MGDPDSITLGCEYYWSFGKSFLTYDEYVKVARLSMRYHRYMNYLQEIKPQWKPLRKILYMDNSIEEEQIKMELFAE